MYLYCVIHTERWTSQGVSGILIRICRDVFIVMLIKRESLESSDDDESAIEFQMEGYNNFFRRQAKIEDGAGCLSAPGERPLSYAAQLGLGPGPGSPNDALSPSISGHA